MSPLLRYLTLKPLPQCQQKANARTWTTPFGNWLSIRWSLSYFLFSNARSFKPTSVTRCWNKAQPNVLQKLPKIFIKNKFFVIAHKSLNIWATFVRRFVTQELLKMRNLITLNPNKCCNWRLPLPPLQSLPTKTMMVGRCTVWPEKIAKYV